jgi:hypothetical protein
MWEQVGTMRSRVQGEQIKKEGKRKKKNIYMYEKRKNIYVCDTKIK